MQIPSLTSLVLPALALAPVVRAQEPLVCDDSAIDWVLPGHFPDAWERARAERRILLIKGVSFGIDAAGAKCATEGTW